MREGRSVRARVRRVRCLATAALLGIIAGPGSFVTLSGATIVVRPDGDLQAAIDQARPGDVIVLEAGATYTGNFILPAKEGSSTRPITIRTSADDRRLPGPSERIGPEDAPLLAKLTSGTHEPGPANRAPREPLADSGDRVRRQRRGATSSRSATARAHRTMPRRCRPISCSTAC